MEAHHLPDGNNLLCGGRSRTGDLVRRGRVQNAGLTCERTLVRVYPAQRMPPAIVTRPLISRGFYVSALTKHCRAISILERFQPPRITRQVKRASDIATPTT